MDPQCVGWGWIIKILLVLHYNAHKDPVAWTILAVVNPTSFLASYCMYTWFSGTEKERDSLTFLRVTSSNKLIWYDMICYVLLFLLHMMEVLYSSTSSSSSIISSLIIAYSIRSKRDSKRECLHGYMWTKFGQSPTILGDWDCLILSCGILSLKFSTVQPIFFM